MFPFARRPVPQRRPIGAPGISEEQYERIRAHLREERADHSVPSMRGAFSRLRFQPATINEGRSP